MDILENSSDEHHCRCFRVNPNDIEFFKMKLIGHGFEQQLTEEDMDKFLD